MGKKMYYTEEEALARLGITKDQLSEYIRDQKLRSYADGARTMYKADEVDALAGGGESSEETGEIELKPASPDASDVMKVSEADTDTARAEGGKEDTVITAEGISIFDEEDLEIETADPMAKTRVAPSVEDQVLIEGVGSGSGLLDLTRESDDTSLGPVLDHIDMESAVGSDIGAVESEPEAPLPETTVAIQPIFVEPVDAMAGLFTGIAAACALLVLLLVAISISVVAETVPSFLEAMKRNMVMVIVGGVLLAVVFGVVGMLVGKSMAAKQEAMRRLSG